MTITKEEISTHQEKNRNFQHHLNAITKPLEEAIKLAIKNFEDKVNSELTPEQLKKMGRPFRISDLDEWDCPKSPFGHCVYGYEDDYDEDCCVFCGQPEERK